MRNDRFKDYDNEVRDLVLEFERTVAQGESQFFDVDELELIADYYIETQDVASLSKVVEFATDLYPGNIELEVRHAQLMMAKEEYRAALSLLLDLRHQEPNNTDVAYSLGICYSGMDEHEKSIACFLQASADGWQLGRTYSNIAEEYYHLERYDEATAYYRRSLEADGRDTVVIYNYYDMAHYLGRLDELIDFYHELLQKYPYCKELWQCVGCAYREKGEYEQAVEAFEYAIASDSSFYSAYVDLAICHEMAGHVGDSATTLLHALDCADSRSAVYVMLATLYGRSGNIDTSLLYARKAVEADPFNPQAYSTMALDYAEVQDMSSAIDYVQQALALADEHPDVLVAAAYVYEMAGQIDRAEQYFDTLLGIECSEQHYLCYVHFLCRMQRWNDLMFFCQQMLEIFPDHTYFTTFLCASLFNTNRYNRARRLLANSDPDMLVELCPTITQNPLFMQLFHSPI